MRIVVLSSSVYSETACAMAIRMAELGHVPVGALALSALDRGTLLRKFRQWGWQDFTHYARTKLSPLQKDSSPEVRNPYLSPMLSRGNGIFRSLHEVASRYRFAVAICRDQNAPGSIARLKDWSPDVILFAGGNILRKPLLDVPRIGVLNAHLGLLPEGRGMSSPEWSLLNNVPVGITIHLIDEGIDTGPILRRYEFPEAAACGSLGDLRNRLIAFGIEKIAEVIPALDRGTISATPQPDLECDHQFFVMHEWLKQRAAERLAHSRRSVVATAHG